MPSLDELGHLEDDGAAGDRDGHQERDPRGRVAGEGQQAAGGDRDARARRARVEGSTCAAPTISASLRPSCRRSAALAGQAGRPSPGAGRRRCSETAISGMRAELLVDRLSPKSAADRPPGPTTAASSQARRPCRRGPRLAVRSSLRSRRGRRPRGRARSRRRRRRACRCAARRRRPSATLLPPSKSCQPNSQGTRMRWPDDEMGRNSVRPWTMPRTMAWMMGIGARVAQPAVRCAGTMRGRHAGGRRSGGRRSRRRAAWPGSRPAPSKSGIST